MKHPRLRWLALCALIAITACNDPTRTVRAIAGDAERGRLLLRQYGCGSCHQISGVANADGRVGPPLSGIAKRVYLGGVLPNSPENMARWIREPQKFDPLTAMPDMQVSESQALDMVAYLYRSKK